MDLRMLGSAALVAALSLVGGKSDAAFTYSSSQAPTGVTVGQTTLTLTGNTGGPFSGTTDIKSIGVGLTSTAPATSTNSFALTFTDTVVINSVGDGTVTLRVNQTLNFTRADTGGSTSTDTLNVGASTLTGSTALFRYTISGLTYAQPTVNGSPGAVSYTITETAVPEPASVAMTVVGLGLAGVAGVRRRRKA